MILARDILVPVCMMIEKVRENIILKKGTLYFDFTASGLGYMPIEKKILKLLETYANTHSEVGFNATQTTDYYNKARDSLKKSLELGDDFYIIPCGTGATGAIKKFQELMGLYIPPATKKRYHIRADKKDLPLVIVGPFEHHSNEVSFREALCEVKRVPLNRNDTIDLEYLRKILEVNVGREIFGSFAVASNVTGILNPVKEIYTLMKKYDATVCFDAAASSPYMNIDSSFYDAMFLSPHKLVGGPGSCGLLVIRKSLCECHEVPTFAGGGTVSYVSRYSHTFKDDIESIEDAGTPGIIQFVKASLAYELRNKIGLDFIKSKEEQLKKIFKEESQKIDNIELYCSQGHKKLAIFSFNIKGIDPYKLAQVLSDRYSIQTRAGCSCAGPYGHDLLGLEDNQEFSYKPGWIRIALHYTHTVEEIRYFFNSLKESIKLLK